MKQIGGLDARNSPFFTATNDDRAGSAEITVVYADRYSNEYQLMIPVQRQRRNERWLQHGYSTG
jgi:hypothetical protein